VIIPNDGLGTAMVERIVDAEYINNPEEKVEQEGQIAILEFRNLKSGKYRVSYIVVGDPLAYLSTLMETHVEVHEKRKESVILFMPFEKRGPILPEDVKAFLMNHRENYLTLDVTYDSSKKSFELTRGRLFNICALRSDGEYHIKVWNHSSEEFPKERKVIFEKTFRAVTTPSDPLTQPSATPKKEESEQVVPSDGHKPPSSSTKTSSTAPADAH